LHLNNAINTKYGYDISFHYRQPKIHIWQYKFKKNKYLSSYRFHHLEKLYYPNRFFFLFSLLYICSIDVCYVIWFLIFETPLFLPHLHFFLFCMSEFVVLRVDGSIFIFFEQMDKPWAFEWEWMVGGAWKIGILCASTDVGFCWVLSTFQPSSSKIGLPTWSLRVRFFVNKL